MSDENPRRTGRFGAILVTLIVGGSTVGVIGWYVLTNRTGPSIDASGFDISAAPQSHSTGSAAGAARTPGQLDSFLSLMKGGAGMRIADPNSSSSGGLAAPSQEAVRKEQARAAFTEQARKHEADVAAFTRKMADKYPLIRQYEKDWMSHPDLRKLNDDYMRNHDPVAFIMSLAQAPSLEGMVKQYAGSPEIIEFAAEGIKEAPGELRSSFLDVLSNYSIAKGVISHVAGDLGVPSVAELINGSGDGAKPDQTQGQAASARR